MSRRPPIRPARGVSLITAVFLIVLLAGLAAALVRVFGAQQSASAMDMLGSQAYQAARSGLEWGMFQQLRVQPPSVGCFTAQRFALPSDGSLRNFSVNVSCTAKVGNTVGDTTNRWTITAVACNLPAGAVCAPTNSNGDYVQRTLQAELN
jgi:MSHA biogenesis protein MshP